MARTITITDNVNTIQLVRTDSQPTSLSTTTDIAKYDIANMNLVGDWVIINLYAPNSPKWIKLDYSDVTSPSYVSGAALYAGLLAMWQNTPYAGSYATSGTFTDADLVDGITTFVLTITHAFATTDVTLTLQDPSGNLVTIYPAVVVDNATITVDFGASIGAGTWSYILIAKP